MAVDFRTVSLLYTLTIVANDSDKLDAILACLKRMETTLSGLQQLRGLLTKGPGREMLDALIVEAEQGVREIKKKITQ